MSLAGSLPLAGFFFLGLAGAFPLPLPFEAVTGGGGCAEDGVAALLSMLLFWTRRFFWRLSSSAAVGFLLAGTSWVGSIGAGLLTGSHCAMVGIWAGSVVRIGSVAVVFSGCAGVWRSWVTDAGAAVVLERLGADALRSLGTGDVLVRVGTEELRSLGAGPGVGDVVAEWSVKRDADGELSLGAGESWSCCEMAMSAEGELGSVAGASLLSVSYSDSSAELVSWSVSSAEVASGSWSGCSSGDFGAGPGCGSGDFGAGPGALEGWLEAWDLDLVVRSFAAAAAAAAASRFLVPGGSGL